MLFTLLYLHPGRGRGVFRILIDWDDGMIEWGQKSKPKKIPWAQQNQKKIPVLKINPQKSHAEFPGLKKPSHKTSLVRVTGALEHFQNIPI